MENKTFEIEVKCLFCEANLIEEEGVEYSSGDMIECPSCHELNDYDSLMEVAIEQGEKMVSDYAEKEIEKMLKDTFKK